MLTVKGEEVVSLEGCRGGGECCERGGVLGLPFWRDCMWTRQLRSRRKVEKRVSYILVK